MNFSQVEPFGSEAMYYGHAITASTIANVHRGKNKKAFETKDFLPTFEQKKPQSANDMIGIAAQLTHAFGGQDKRK